MALARWETRFGKYWVDLWRELTADGLRYVYSYRGKDCGGCLGVLPDDVTAISAMEKTVVPYIAPDAAKIGMQRTI